MAVVAVSLSVVGVEGRLSTTPYTLVVQASLISKISSVVPAAVSTGLSTVSVLQGAASNITIDYQVSQSQATLLALLNTDIITGNYSVSGDLAVAGKTTLSGPLLRKITTGAAINATATATAAQIATGLITSTSAAATAITMPTGTLLGTELGATRGTSFDFVVDNTLGANTVTMIVAVNGILSAAAAANGASQGLLTVPSGVTGIATFRLVFASATAYVITRIA